MLKLIAPSGSVIALAVEPSVMFASKKWKYECPDALP